MGGGGAAILFCCVFVFTVNEVESGECIAVE